LFNLLNGVPLSIWYDWKDDGTDPHEVEHHFGTIDHDGKPKPAYLAAKTLAHELDGYRLQRRLETGADDYVLLFVNSNKHKVAAWTTAGAHAV
jgi:hypothetical protein